MKDIDCIIHLAGIPQDDAWDKLETINIHGTYNVFEAARRQNVKRIIFASTNQVIGFYRNGKVLNTTVPLRPASFYGVTKVFGEALARLYADKFGIEVACIRIGSLQEKPTEVRHLTTWLSHQDFIRLVIKCIEAQYHFTIIYGVSGNKRNLWDNSFVENINFSPIDNAENYVSDPALHELRNDIGKQFQGGHFCEAEFTGDPSKID